MVGLAGHALLGSPSRFFGFSAGSALIFFGESAKFLVGPPDFSSDLGLRIATTGAGAQVERLSELL
jgi:hypothetical protein